MRTRPPLARIAALMGLLGLPLVPPSSRATAGQDGSPTAPPRVVLVELYSSQGCNSCPPAAEVLHKVAADRPGAAGSSRVVALNFHVDYFNNPWVDPYSDPSFSDRQLSYNQVFGRDDLYFTPMMMVDGKTPLLGSNGARASAAIREAKLEPPAVALDLDLSGPGPGPRKQATVRLAARSADLAGRDLLVGVAITQDRATTRVPRGENAGKTLEEFHVVRRLDHKFVQLDRSKPSTLTFPVALPSGVDPANFRVAAFVQDRQGGRVYQAQSLPWESKPQPPRTSRP